MWSAMGQMVRVPPGQGQAVGQIAASLRSQELIAVQPPSGA